MAKTSFCLVPMGLEEMRGRALTSGDRFLYSTIRRKPVSVSRKLKNKLLLKSVIPIATQYWRALSIEQREAWASASFISGQTPFALFLRDVAYRLKYDLPAQVNASDIVQYMCGQLEITAPATAIKIEQIHPLNYFINHKVQGTRDTYEPVKIIESFDLPLEIKISHRTSLTSAGASPKVSFYALVLSHYQGRNIETKLEIPFGLTDEWQNNSATLSTVFGLIKGYSVYIEAVDVQGIIQFDNVDIIHSGQNWARDKECNNINSIFTKAFQQIPRHWAPEVMPEGAYYSSVFCNYPEIII